MTAKRNSILSSYVKIQLNELKVAVTGNQSGRWTEVEKEMGEFDVCNQIRITYHFKISA